MSYREPRSIRLLEDRWTTVRHLVESVAILAAGLWAFYTFIYQEKIKPAREPASLSDSVEVRRLGRDARRDILGVSLEFENTGKTEIDIAADAFNVLGVRVGAGERKVFYHSLGRQHFSRQLPVTLRRIVDAFVELREAAVGGRPGEHIVLEAGEKVTLREVVAIPRGRYDFVHAQIIAVPVKTPVEAKVRVDVIRYPSGAYALQPESGDETDNATDFALIP